MPENSRYAGAFHRVIPLRYENYLDRAMAFREAVWDELERQSYDIVHFRSMWAAVPVEEEKQRQGFAVVAEVNGVESIELKYHYPMLRSATELLTKLRRQEQQAFDCADIILTPSDVTRRYLVHRQVPDSKLRVIPNGVDVQLFTPAPRHRDAAEPLTLLYIGTLAPWQGLDILLKAMHLLTPHHALSLRIVSPDSRKWQRPIAKLIHKLALEERVEILPACPHEMMPAVIQQADICVAPLAPTERNIRQGCHPLKVLEYLACGKPIIAADLPVVREILTPEHDAILCRVDKPSHLAESLLRLAEDATLRQRLGEQAACTARERFGWERAQQALCSVYDELLDSNREYVSRRSDISLAGV
ncbi:MAG TPA: glycosyltransferase family 4 protein [Armatimonadota bacterium]|nr:glycosyltransferase family 4 protein [Armatimonadota bacterium]